MTTFEEQFPSLKEKDCATEIYSCDSLDKKRKLPCIRYYRALPGALGVDVSCINFILFKEDVQKYCLDKQRVREALENEFPGQHSNPYCGEMHHTGRPIRCSKCSLLQELGL